MCLFTSGVLCIMTKFMKKFVILLVAMLVCATVVFAACSKANFKPVSKPDQANAESNGGIAVKYGEWLYYVNGYTADVSAENTYSNDVKDAPRIGSVVRIKLAEIEKILAINDDDDLTPSQKTDNIAAAIRGGTVNEVEYAGAETVIPKIYYSGNTTTTQFTGIHIFNDRIYVTTPSDKLTPNGDSLTDQLILMSFDLGGGDSREHFTFTSNSAQIWLTETDNKLIATYFMSDTLHVLDVAQGKDTIVTNQYSNKTHLDNTVSSVNWDASGYVFFIDEFGSLCKLTVGQTEYEVILDNNTSVNHGDHIERGSLSYTITSANKGIVYYTENDTEQDTVSGGKVLCWAKTATEKGTALASSDAGAYGWEKDKVIVMKPKESTDGKKYYGLWLYTAETVASNTPKMVLAPAFNENSITIDKIEGDILCYTADSVSYKINLAEVEQANYDATKQGTPYAYSLASTTGWAEPDFITYNGSQYVISLSTDTVSLVKFNPEDKTNSKSIALTLTAEPEKE